MESTMKETQLVPYRKDAIEPDSEIQGIMDDERGRKYQNFFIKKEIITFALKKSLS